MLTIAGSMIFRVDPEAGSGQVQRMSCRGAAVVAKQGHMTQVHKASRLRTLERNYSAFCINQRT